ncbi:ABC transporter substrate-binding protein [Rhodovastum atsumiense]|uniref:ABC transporter substrate-binding protein n=2 Tax=Rhodovastum atsumiense TaxID=504468 RepID=A0A5M6IR02_9PROT|nr:ABC transporter substrate-binding protein [Rhodovastum atsumiense]
MQMTRRGVLAASTAGVLLNGIWQPAARAAGTPRRGGSLTATWGGFEPQALFVPGGGGSSPFMTSTKVLERLLGQTSDLKFVNILAESVQAAPDFRSYTLRLREGVTWHDGRPFAADDVVFSVLQFWKPFALTVALKALTGAEAKDPRTVVLSFASPVPDFYLRSTLSGQNSVILPKHLYEGRDLVTNPVNNKPIGTGPWVVREWVRGSHVEYERNPNYWDSGKPYLDRLFIRWWRDPASRAAAFEAGELDMGISNPVPVPDIERLTRTGRFQATTRGYETCSWCATIEFNLRRENVNRREVRQALLHGIDRQFIVDTVYFGKGKVGTSPIHSNNPVFYNRDVPRYDFDPAKAARLLDAAGLKKRRGGRFTVQLLAANWFEENAKNGQYVKQALEDLDITVNLTTPDRATSLKRIYTDYDFDIALSNYTAPIEPVPIITQYYTTDGIVKGAPFRNANGFSDPAMDDLVSHLATETDEAKRKVLANQFQADAVAQANLLPMVEFDSFTVTRSDVRNHSGWANYIGESWADLWREG